MDRSITERVARAGRVLGIRLLDHVVIGAGTYRSMVEEGLVDEWPVEPDLL